MSSEYPQHEKLKAVKYDHQLISSFVEWLQDQEDAGIAEWIEDQYWPISGTVQIERLIARFFDIDRDEFLREKERMYQELRRLNESRAAAWEIDDAG